MGLTPTKKLVDLDPEWALVTGRIVGLWFSCPNCGQLMAAWFANPDDGGPSIGKVTWGKQGVGFENLTLTPSFRLGCCGWHGHIMNGEVVDSGQP